MAMEQQATSRNASTKEDAPATLTAGEAPETHAASATPFGVVVAPEMVTPIQVSPPEMVAIRRRRRRRRSRADKAETPQRRAYIALLCVVFVLMAIAAIKSVRQTLYNGLHSISPTLARHGIGLEVIALVLAGLILLYLMPGMEDRIVRLVSGNKRR